MCSVPDWFDHVTVSPSAIVSVDGVKQNVGPPQSAGIVTTGSPAAPARDAGTNAITKQAKPAELRAKNLRTDSYTDWQPDGFKPRELSGLAGMHAGQTGGGLLCWGAVSESVTVDGADLGEGE
jgi:hypothetical protein